MTDDGDISRRYRELPREEPPRHVDDAIRAAARRAVGTRPAPLVVPTGRQRWYFPLAAAAVIMLAVAVTLHVEREQPGEEIASAPAAPATSPPVEEPRAEARTEKPQSAPQPERRRKNESADSRELRDAAPPQLQKAPEPAPAPPAAVAAPRPPPPVATQDAIRGAQESAAGALASRAETAPKASSPPAARPDSAQLRRVEEGRRAAPLSAFALQSPEQWLQGIADLRKQGRHDEADRSLAEFRKRHPGYQIPEAMLEKVEKR
jgi:hypothetical protein